MANAVIDTAMAGRAAVCHRPSLGRPRRCYHEHGADDAAQRIARAASDFRPPLRRMPMSGVRFI